MRGDQRRAQHPRVVPDTPFVDPPRGSAAVLGLNDIVPPTPPTPTTAAAASPPPYTSAPARPLPTPGAIAAIQVVKAHERAERREARGQQRLEAKMEKAVRYRNLTCPRRKFIVQSGGAADGTAPARSAMQYREHDIWGFAVHEFEHYGLGIGLYFRLLNSLIWLFVLLGLIAVPELIFNLSAGNVDGTFQHSGVSSTYVGVEATMLGNLGYGLAINVTSDSIDVFGRWPLSKSNVSLIIGLADLLGCLIFLYFVYAETSNIRNTSIAYRKHELTTVHFTVQVTNLPPGLEDRNSVRQFFQDRWGPVVDVVIAFNDHQLVDAYRRRGDARKSLAEAEENAARHAAMVGGRANGDADPSARIDHEEEQDEWVVRIQAIDAEIEHIRRTVGIRRAMCAWVTFDRQEDRMRCLRAFPEPLCPTAQKLFRCGKPEVIDLADSDVSINAPEEGSCSSCGCGSGGCCTRAPKVVFHGYPIHVMQAPEPSNILYENIHYGEREKLCRKCSVYLITLIILLISVTIVYVAQYFQRQTPQSKSCPETAPTQAEMDADPTLRGCYCNALLGTSVLVGSSVDCTGWVEKANLGKWMTLISAVTIVLVNYLLRWAITQLGKWERHRSVTTEQSSITLKMFVGLFLNTGLVLLLVNANFSYHIRNIGFTIAFDGAYDDFVVDWYTNVGVSVFLTMLFNMFNPHIYPLLMVPYRNCRRQSCIPPNPSQGELNRLYAGDEFELAERYASLLNTMFVALFYAAGIPMLYFVAAITFALQYWFDKISFLRLYRLPPRYDHTLASDAVSAFPYALLVHCAMSIWFFTGPVLTSTTLLDHRAAGVQSTISEYSSTFSIQSRFYQSNVLPLFILLLLLVGRQLLNGAMGWALCQYDVDSELLKEKRRFRTYREARAEGRDFESYHLHRQHQFHDAFIRTPSRRQLPALRSLDELDLISAEKAQTAAQRAELERNAIASEPPHAHDSPPHDPSPAPPPPPVMERRTSKKPAPAAAASSAATLPSVLASSHPPPPQYQPQSSNLNSTVAADAFVPDPAPQAFDPDQLTPAVRSHEAISAAIAAATHARAQSQSQAPVSSAAVMSHKSTTKSMSALPSANGHGLLVPTAGVASVRRLQSDRNRTNSFSANNRPPAPPIVASQPDRMELLSISPSPLAASQPAVEMAAPPPISITVAAVAASPVPAAAATERKSSRALPDIASPPLQYRRDRIDAAADKALSQLLAPPTAAGAAAAAPPSTAEFAPKRPQQTTQPPQPAPKQRRANDADVKSNDMSSVPESGGSGKAEVFVVLPSIKKARAGGVNKPTGPVEKIKPKWAYAIHEPIPTRYHAAMGHDVVRTQCPMCVQMIVLVSSGTEQQYTCPLCRAEFFA